MDTITGTRRYRAIVRYLSRDSGGTPCSRYGRNGAECAPFAAVVDMILGLETGKGTSVESVNAAMGMVVNDSDDVAITIVMHGAEHGIDLFQWLGDVEVRRVIFEDIPFYYDRDTQDALASIHLGIDLADESHHPDRVF